MYFNGLSQQQVRRRTTLKLNCQSSNDQIQTQKLDKCMNILVCPLDWAELGGEELQREEKGSKYCVDL